MNKMNIFSLFTILLILLSGCFNESNESSAANKLTVSQPCLPVKNSCEILIEKNIKLRLKFIAPPSYQRLLPINLESREATLENVAITMLIGDEEMPTENMTFNDKNNVWEAQLLPFATVSSDNIRLRLIITYKSQIYTAEFPVVN